MPEQVVIDSLDFAQSGKTLHGKIPVADLSRVHEFLQTQSGEIEYTLKGYVDERNRPALHCEIHGLLQLECQRCLGALPFPLEVVSDVVLLPGERELEKLAEENAAADAIVVERELDAAVLIEEEILLALPMAPKHPTGECHANSHAARPDDSEQKPLQALASLRLRNKGKQ